MILSLQPPYKLLLLISYPQGGSQFVGKMVTFRDRSSFCILSKATLNKSQPFYETTFLLLLLLLLPGFYELTRLIYLCSCRNCLTRIYILQIIMQARGHYSKLNFTFLRFPLSQRSIFYKMILASKAQMVTTTCIIFNPEDFLELLLLLTPIKTKENQSVIKIQR